MATRQAGTTFLRAERASAIGSVPAWGPSSALKVVLGTAVVLVGGLAGAVVGGIVGPLLDPSDPKGAGAGGLLGGIAIGGLAMTALLAWFAQKSGDWGLALGGILGIGLGITAIQLFIRSW
jgi:hypothetical protein